MQKGIKMVLTKNNMSQIIEDKNGIVWKISDRVSYGKPGIFYLNNLKDRMDISLHIMKDRVFYRVVSSEVTTTYYSKDQFFDMLHNIFGLKAWGLFSRIEKVVS